VALSGVTSAFFVTLVNSMMNLPAGFTMRDGHPVDIDPVQAMWSPPWPHQTLHSLLACYQATAFALAGIHAAVLLRHPRSPLFRKALGLTLAVACATALIQPLSGHDSAASIADLEPQKLAAAEGHFHTGRRAPLLVGGIPDDDTGEMKGALRIPGGLSFLATGSFDGEVKGLDALPREDWPPVAKTHLAFDAMVGAGMAMSLLALVAAVLALRRRGLPDQRWFLRAVAERWFLRAVVASGPLGLVALEAGWCVTELGRQPWIVHGALRTRDAVTPFPHLAAPFWLFTLVYVFLGVAVVYLLYHQLRAAPPGHDGGSAGSADSAGSAPKPPDGHAEGGEGGAAHAH
jgi:cytochrome d ubiquinol oxidase subunit I